MTKRASDLNLLNAHLQQSLVVNQGTHFLLLPSSRIVEYKHEQKSYPYPFYSYKYCDYALIYIKYLQITIKFKEAVEIFREPHFGFS